MQAAVITVPETKACSVCKEEKPAADFYREKRHRDGLYSYCIPCAREIRRESERRKQERMKVDPQYREHQRQRARVRGIKHRFGLTEEEIAALPDRCEICGATENLHIDHDHVTGKVRGRLCQPCNHMIGNAKDDPERLRAAIAYLEGAV